MKKEINYHVKREIEWLPLIDELDAVAYIERKYEDGVLTHEQEGIATLAEIESRTINTPIKHLRIEVPMNGKMQEVPLNLYVKGAREIFRRNHMGDEKGMKNIQKAYINSPYTHLKENGPDSAEALLLYYAANAVYDLEGKMLPKAVYFDYITAHIDNAYYDLEEFHKALMGRNDIEFIHDRYGKSDIKDIPYFNAEEGRDRCMEFFWYPSDEDFAKVREEFDKNSFDRYKNIIEIVFGVKTLEPEDE